MFVRSVATDRPARSTARRTSRGPLRRVLTALVPLAVVTSGMVLAQATPAAAAIPAIPRVNDGRVAAMAVIGTKVYVGGSFTALTLQNGTVVSRASLFSYDLNTGAYNTAFVPVIAGGTVNALSPTPDGTGLLVGGTFATVNGTTQRRLARLSTTGALVTTFKPVVSAAVSSIAVTSSRIFIGGSFTTVGGVSRPKLAEVLPTTGALVTAFNFGIGGNAAVGGFVGVQGLDVSPDGKRLVVAHNGVTVGGQERYGVAVIDLGTGATTSTLNPWFTTLWKDNLFRNGGVVRVTNVAWGTTGTWFITTNTGGDRPPTNDSVQRFDVSGPGPVDPTWVTRQFDSSYGVDVGADGTIYIGGHFRYTEAPGSPEPWPGEDSVNYGFGPAGGAVVLGSDVVERGQLDALDPDTGKAKNWYHTANGQHGITALKVVGKVLMIGQDGALVDGRTVGRHGLVPTIDTPSDTTKPLTVPSTPLMGGVLPIGSTVISGTATAPAGVRSVAVELKKGTSWVKADGTLSTVFVALPATLGTPNGTSTSWSVTVPLTATGSYQAFPKATDTAGVKEPVRYAVPFQTVDFSNTPPVITVTTPQPNQQDFTTNTITVSGTATDADGIAAVQLSYFNQTQASYVQPNGTLGDFVSFSATLGGTGTTRTWTHTLTVPDGEYNLFVNAVDSKGAALARSIAVAFVMSPGNPAPSVTITSPTSNTAIGSTLTISGTATDNTSVRQVLVRMTDGRFGLGPQIGGGFGLPGTIPATLGTPNAASTTWSLTVTGLPVGVYAFTVFAVDDVGIATPTALRIPVTGLQQRPVGSLTPEPSTAVTSPADASAFRASTLAIPLSGTAGYAGGVSGIKLVVKDVLAGRYLQPDGTTGGEIAYLDKPVASPGATSTAWSTSLTVPNASQWQVDAIAVGSDGNLDWSASGARFTYFVYPGDADPFPGSATGTAAVPGTPNVTLNGNQVSAGGRAFDDIGVDGVQVMIRTSTTSGLRADGTIGTPQWLTGTISNPGGLFTQFNFLSTALPAGTWTVLVRAVDSVGKTTLTTTVPPIYQTTVTVV